MLRFANNPDKIFSKILELAFQYGIEIINDCFDDYEFFECFLPRASKFITPEISKRVLGELLRYSKDSDLWGLNDYHYCLIYDLLENFCSVQNDLQKDSNEPILITGESKIREIDFESIVDHYFFDEDFLTEKDIFLNMTKEIKDQMGFSPETFGVIMGLKPHSDELKIKLYKRGEFHPGEPEAHIYKKGSEKYPDYDFRKYEKEGL